MGVLAMESVASHDVSDPWDVASGAEWSEVLDDHLREKWEEVEFETLL